MPSLTDRYSAEKKPWFSAADIPLGEQLTLVIGQLELDTYVGSKKLDVLRFPGEDQFLIVDHRFFGPALVSLLGDDSDTWPGKKITLFTEMAEIRGERKPVLRVRAAPEDREAAFKADFDDGIPF